MQLEDHEPMLVIWEFVISPGLTQNALQPQHDYTGTNDTPTMPWLELRNCSCNCTMWPISGTVQVSNKHKQADLSVVQVGGETENNAEDEIQVNESGMEEEGTANDVPLVCEVFKLKGCSFHPAMQKALRAAQKKIAEKEEVEVKIFDQPVNVKDDNALIAKVLLSDVYEPIGYIPGRKVQKFREALKNNEITLILLKQVHREYILAVNNFMLFGYVHAIKKGRWLPDNKLYKYNS